MKLYISGPMSAFKDTDYNFPAFFEMQKKLEALGHEVVNPASLGIVEGMTHRQYVDRDIEVMRKSNLDGVVTLPDWWDSEGAMEEVRFARDVLDIPYYSYDHFEKIADMVQG